MDISIRNGGFPPQEWTDEVLDMMDEEQIKNAIQRVKEMPDDVKIFDGMLGLSTKAEFLEVEEKIAHLLGKVEKSWRIVEKAAYIYNQLGEIYQYSTEAGCQYVYSERENSPHIAAQCRPFYNSMSTGISVCNGISNAYQVLLHRLGIESKIIHAKKHVYLAFVDENGKSILTDPTWDLCNTKFGLQPEYFGISYEEMQANNENNQVTDESVLGDVRILSKEEVFKINKEIGNVVESDGQTMYRGDAFLQDIGSYDKNQQTPEEFLSNAFLLAQQEYGEKTKCMDEMQQFMFKIILNNFETTKEIKANARMVYRSDDKEKKPISIIKLRYLGEFSDMNPSYFVNDPNQFYISTKEPEELLHSYKDYANNPSPILDNITENKKQEVIKEENLIKLAKGRRLDKLNEEIKATKITLKEEKEVTIENQVDRE